MGNAAARQFAFAGKWGLGADGLQWILYRERHAVSFVSSTRGVLERCMRESGCSVRSAACVRIGRRRGGGGVSFFDGCARC